MFKMLEGVFGMKGTKLWMAVLVYVVCELVKQVVPEWSSLADEVEKYFVLPMGVVGLGHKLDKAS